MQYWINVVSRDHVQRGVDGGFTQANHGKPWALKKMKKGDQIVFYSPKTEFENGEPLQAFTAICQVIDVEPYQVEAAALFQPWRRNVSFEITHEALIKPLILKLDFIENKIRWGYKFRFGVFEISESDFKTIKHAMT
jgi:predicted RNA-binding protein